MKQHEATPPELLTELAAIAEQKTEALFLYLCTIQDLDARRRKLQISDELAKIAKAHDEALRDLLLANGK